jgi:hypothetical protein
MAGPVRKSGTQPKFQSQIGTAVAVKRMPNGKIVQVNPRANMAPPKPNRTPIAGRKRAY